MKPELEQRELSQSAGMGSADEQARFLQLANAMPQLVWMTSADGGVTFVNSQWKSYSGLSLAQTTRVGIAAAVHPDDRESLSERCRSALTTGAAYETQCRIKRHSDGSYRWFLIRTVPLRDDRGEAWEWVGTATDIDERMRAEALLRESERRFHSLADDAPATIFIKDLDGRYTYANRRACESLGRPEVVGLFDYDLIPTATAAELRRRDLELVANRQPAQREVNLHGRWLLLAKSPLYDAGGQPLGVCGMGIDITARKQAEEALVEADRRKDDFLAVLAHELRNPLAPIRNSLEALKLDQLSQKQRKPVEVIERQLSNLIRLVDDLLDVGRITSGKLELRPQEVMLSDIFQVALETARPYMDAARHHVDVRLPVEPVRLHVDKMRLAQVLANLLHNSAKYTPSGGRIQLQAELLEDGVEICVRDNGIGIPRQSLHQVFQMFAQADAVRGRTVGGLGIGLALVKALVEMHGGTVHADSEGEGCGSTFVIRLPPTSVSAAVLATAPEARSDLPQSEIRRMLVVDDNVDSAASMTMLLDLLGHETREAHDGLQAIEAAAQFRPDVILMDIGMPNMDGLEATRRIREMALPRQPFIVALTGWGQQSDRLLTQRAGVDHHLVKPVALETITDLLAQLEQRP